MPNITHLDRHADRIAADIVQVTGDELDAFRLPVLAAMLGVSEGFLKKANAAGTGPKPTYLTPRCLIYRRDDVLKYLDERAGRWFKSAE